MYPTKVYKIIYVHIFNTSNMLGVQIGFMLWTKTCIEQLLKVVCYLCARVFVYTLYSVLVSFVTPVSDWKSNFANCNKLFNHTSNTNMHFLLINNILNLIVKFFFVCFTNILIRYLLLFKSYTIILTTTK